MKTMSCLPRRMMIFLCFTTLVHKAVSSVLRGAPQTNFRPRASRKWWSPKASDKLTWQWQLQGAIDTTVDVDMYDVDLFDTPQSVIDQLHADGRIVVCYFSAGSYEYWRDDWAEFFDIITAKQPYEGSEPPFAGQMTKWNERWLDIRRVDLLTPIMTSRISLAASKGCDAIEPDHMDAYSQYQSETGLPLTYEDQIAYNRFIAKTAHAYGLSVGLKNDMDQLEDLVDDFDWALNEDCFHYDECDSYRVFTDVDKAVFGVEYHGNLCHFCSKAHGSNLSWMKKEKNLNVWRQGCSDSRTLERCNASNTAPGKSPISPPKRAPVIAPVKAPIAEPVTAPVAEPVRAPVAEPVTAPITKPVAEPVAEPVLAPVIEPIAAPITEPVSVPVSEPTAAPVTDAPTVEP